MSLTTKFREFFSDVDQKAVDATQAHAVENDVSFEAAAEHCVGPDRAEDYAERAYHGYVEQKAEGLVDEDVDQKGVLSSLQRIIRNDRQAREAFKNQRQFLQWLDSLEADRAKMDDLGITDDNIELARREARTGNIPRATAMLHEGRSVSDRIVDRISEFVNDIRGKATDQNMQETDSKLNMDVLDDGVQDDIESLSEELDKDPADIARMLGISAPDGDEDEEVDQSAEDNDEDMDEKAVPDDVVTEEELDEKLESHKEEVVDAISDEDVVEGLAQKLSQNEEFQDSVVETVDQKSGVVNTPTPDNSGEASRTLREAAQGGDE